MESDKYDKIRRVVERARDIGMINKKSEVLGLFMDIDVIQREGSQLDLDRLLSFPDEDFAHDIAGIINHLNRITGELEDCFVPRCEK